MLLRFINCAGQRKEDRGLKMLIDPIQLQPEASQYSKKILVTNSAVDVFTCLSHQLDLEDQLVLLQTNSESSSSSSGYLHRDLTFKKICIRQYFDFLLKTDVVKKISETFFRFYISKKKILEPNFSKKKFENFFWTNLNVVGVAAMNNSNFFFYVFGRFLEKKSRKFVSNR